MFQARSAVTNLYNQWVYVTAEYEKTLTRIGRDIFQAYKAEKLRDTEAREYCELLSGIYNQATSVRREVQDDIEKRLFQNQLNSKSIAFREVAEESLGRAIRLWFKKRLSRGALSLWDEKYMPGYKATAKDVIFGLANRAISCSVRDEPLVEKKDHKMMCELALQLERDCLKAWEEIIEWKEQNRSQSGVSFHLIGLQFVQSCGSFLRKSKVSKDFFKLIGFSENVEKTKLIAQYAKMPEGDMLIEQLQSL